MKIVVISDTHGQHRRLVLPPGDLLLHAGDSTLKGRLPEVQDFLAWFARQPFRNKIFIAGNHDFYFEKNTPAAIEALLPEGVVYLQDSGIVIDGVSIWGTPVTPWFFDWAFNRRRGAAINKHWLQIPDTTQLLVTHGPAYGILDFTTSENHVGDKDLLRRIEAIKPAVHVCGHVHEAYGLAKRGVTKFINASVMNETYDLVHPPIVFDL